MDCKHCRGCHDDFYNGKNDLGVTECWSLKKAELVTRFQLHRDSVPTRKANFTKVKVPNCYHVQDYVFYKSLPEFAK